MSPVLPLWLQYTFVFIWGLIWGSFYNVCIYRIPNKISIVTPPSHCPICKHQLSWYDNIPILSYLLLKAKCRYCNTHISLRYPLIEGISGVLNIIVYWKYPQIETFAIFSFFWGCMLVVTMIDWDEFIIPDLIMYPLIIIGLILLFFHQLPEVSIISGIAGIIIGGLLPYIIAITFEKIKKLEDPALGGGDIKLLALFGIFFGIKGVIAILIIGSLLGIIIGYPLVKLSGKKLEDEDIENKELVYIPFGPFLILGALIVFIIGGDNIFYLINNLWM